MKCHFLKIEMISEKYAVILDRYSPLPTGCVSGGRGPKMTPDATRVTRRCFESAILSDP